MALRTGGTYLLAASALHSQSRIAHHLARMESAASDSMLLGMASDAEWTSSVSLGEDSAIDSVEGLNLQGESMRLEIDAERERLASTIEYGEGNAYEAEAEDMRFAAEGDMAASGTHLAVSRGDAIESASSGERARAEAESATADLEASAVSWEGSVDAGEVAMAAERRAIEDGVLVASETAKGLRHGKALVEAETTAMEDVDAMAACSPVPVLDLLCAIVGGVIEVGYQSIAAIDGAEAAMEGVSAGIARGEERAELALVVERREEAARLAMEAERLRDVANDEAAMAANDGYRAEVMGVEAMEEEALGEEELVESEREEASAVVLEEKASEEYAKAARDEGIAVEEDQSAIAAQVESEELMSKSTGEEIESLAERADATSKDAEAERLLKQSVDYGMRALGYAIHAIVTAGLVVYVVAIGGIVNMVVPNAGRVWSGERQLSLPYVLERSCDILIHLSVAVGSIASNSNLLSNFEGISAPMKIRALFHLAAVAGVIESVVKCLVVGSTIASASLAFFSNLVHFIPAYMMELLIVEVLLGPGIFDNIIHEINPVSIWGILLLTKCISAWIVVSNANSTEHMQDQRPMSEGECNILCARVGNSKEVFTPADAALNYGSVESLHLLSTSDENDNIGKEINSSSTPVGCLERCRRILLGYCEGLRLQSDLLLLSLMVALLRHCWPLLEVLHPVAENFLSTFTAWVSLPIMIGVTVVLLVIVHFLFVH